MPFTLPSFPGTYPVGTAAFAVPIAVGDDAARVVGSAKLKGTSTPALKLEEVCFTAFYPADVAVKDRAATPAVSWMPRCVVEYFEIASPDLTIGCVQTSRRWSAWICPLWRDRLLRSGSHIHVRCSGTSIQGKDQRLRAFFAPSSTERPMCLVSCISQCPPIRPSSSQGYPWRAVAPRYLLSRTRWHAQ